MLSSTDVAKLCGITINRFSVLKKSPYYQQVHNQYMTGILTVMDQNVRKNYDISEKTLQFAVPLAMQGLVQQALNAKDERVKNKAYNDILDRDGRFAKVSRIGMTVAENPSVAEDKDNKAVLEMLSAINSTKPKATIDNTPPLTERTQ